MAEPDPKQPFFVQPPAPVACRSCGKTVKIPCAVRSAVCSCGARLVPAK